MLKNKKQQLIIIKGITSFVKKHKYIFILLLLIVVAVVCQLYKINRDFYGEQEFDACLYNFFAQNLTQYGLVKTKLGAVCNTSPLTGQFLYYSRHPTMAIYIYALFFKIFGSGIIIGRLISIFFFLLGTICFYLLVSKLWSKKIALWASFFYLFFPISQYFGKFVSKETITMPLIFLFLWFYYLWVKENRVKHFYLMLVSFFLGCLTNWPIYYLAPVTIIHYRYILKHKNKQVFALLLIAVSCFISFFAFNYFLTGSWKGIQSQWPVNMQVPLVGVIKHAITVQMQWQILFQSHFYIKLIEYLLYSFTLPALLIALYFLFNYQRFKYLRKPIIYILFIPILYIAYGIFFPKLVFHHIYVVVYFSAILAVICALVISKISKAGQIIFVIIFLLFSIFSINTLYKWNNTNSDRFMLAKIIPAISQQGETVALSEPFFSPFIEYYGQREILYDVISWERLHYIVNTGKINFFITNFKEFQEYLIDKFPVIFLPNNFAVFDIRAKGILMPIKRYNISFDNNINLINYSFKSLSKEYFLLDYVWQKTEEEIDEFKVLVHFEDQDGKYLFGQDHFISNGFIDLTKLDNRMINESYIIKIPQSALGKKVSIYVGLYSPITWQRVKVINLSTIDNRVSLGQINI
ncbi:glycosyltransferase family 39 protein [Patescibacteria group bacterium]|nr:glycosyltransferase family 39 protein [Patescibacteria group bacterium]